MTEPNEPLVRVGWYCWRCEGLVEQPCRSDNVPVSVPQEWAADMEAEIRRLGEEGDDVDLAANTAEQPAAGDPVNDQTPDAGTPWCCTGLGFVSTCPLCPQYGTSLVDFCPGHEGTEENQTRVVEARLHAQFRHPGYEYRTTKGPRKQWDNPDQPPTDDNGEPEPGWEPNIDAGHPGEGWERFDYHEEAYWRRPKKTPNNAGKPARTIANNPAVSNNTTDNPT